GVGDTDAGVSDLEEDAPGLGGLGGIRPEADLEGDRPAGGRELNGVVEEVVEDLAEARGVGEKPEAGGAGHGEGDLLFEGAFAEQQCDGLDHALELEIEVFQRDVARLDFGEVEDVIDEGEQMA